MKQDEVTVVGKKHPTEIKSFTLVQNSRTISESIGNLLKMPGK